MATTDSLHPPKHRYNLKSRYDILKSLGQGTYGKVKLAVDKVTGLTVAIKSISKRSIINDNDLIRIRREIDIMASLNHKHVIQVFEVFENQDKIIIVMEYAEGGELYDHISSRGKLAEKEARKLFRQIVSAVHYLHEKGIAHRDLKLENILLDKNGQVKLVDFGLSNTWNHDSFLHTFCGSPLYASPEIVNGRPYYGPEVDCWSLGVLLYTLVYGSMPFDGSDFHRLKKQISTGSYYEPIHQSSAASLIQAMLTVNPAKRANITDIASHWWTNKDCSSLDEEISPSQSRHTSDYFEDCSMLCNLKEKCNRVVVTSVFDSDKKPKKGILKNRTRSSEMPSCELSEELSISSNNRIACAKPEAMDTNLDINEEDLVEDTKLKSLQQDASNNQNDSSIMLSGDLLDFMENIDLKSFSITACI